MITPSAYDPSSEEEERLFPASLAQQRLWFLTQWEPSTASSPLALAVRVSMALEPEALAHSLQALVQRQGVLRTTCRVTDGHLLQVLRPTLPVPLQVVDVPSLPASQREARVQQVHREQLHQPFDLIRGPLWRTTVLLLDQQEAVLLLTGHPLLFDGGSMGQFFQEWITLYQALCHQQPAPLPPLSSQYADFAQWQRMQLAGDRLSEHLAYWKQHLQGAPTMLEWPTAYPPSSVPSAAAAVCPFVVPQPVRAALQALMRQEGGSWLALATAALQSVLYRYTAQDDLLVGTLQAAHRLPQFQGLLGNFLSPLVLRSDLSGHPTGREMLRRVQQGSREAERYQEVPYEQLVQELQGERVADPHPLVPVWVSLEPSLPLLPSGWAFSQEQVEPRALPYDLLLELDEVGFTGRLCYHLDRFAPASMERMVGHWQRVLEGMATAPDQPIAELPLLTPGEWQQQVVAWNATQTTAPHQQSYAELFEAQVEHTPEAVAVVCGHERLSYREVNRRANQLAHHLQQLGMVPETLVALLLERGIDFVVALLAVLKAGAAFLPLDPQHPVQRQCEILKQSHCRYVLTVDMDTSELAEALREIDVDERPQLIQIEASSQTGQAEDNPPTRSVPGNLAYVMYTSGSTGAPKGVMVEQAGMINHMSAKIADLSISMEDRVAQNAPPCFDIVVWQCLAALLLGGSVHIFKDEIAHNPLRLLRQIDEQKITIVQMVPSLLRAVVQQAEMLGETRPRLEALRWIVPTGDALSPELCRQWFQLYSTIPMLNNCGSTECSDDNCHYAIHQPPPLDYPLSIMPIGRPIQNMQAYVLDQRLMPVPIGVVGDLYIGGIGVGRGYLHDAERTAQVFLPDPFAQEPGARLYKTRDRARYLPDGLLEFLGRSDNLIKIRGLRIEPGEIEAVLERHPAIRETIVLARDAKGGNKYLVAYLVPSKNLTPTDEELRSWLRDKLPEYMIPTIFVSLEAMPLNSNGKLDRQALPIPDQTRTELQSTFVKARTSLEETISAIWSQVLEIEQVGIHDNFLTLGGHSLLAMQIASRLRATLHVDVPLRSFFEAPTVAQLAEVITHLQAQDAGTRMSGLRSRSREAYRMSASSLLSTQGSTGSQNEEET